MRVQNSKRVPDDLPEIDLARLAAFIDGEGHIGIGRSRTGRDKTNRVNFKMWVCIGNTDARLMTWLKRFVVGNFYMHAPDGRGRRHSFYQWTVRCQEATDLLNKLLPYFVMKRDQAEIALEFSKTMLRTRKTGGNGQFCKLSDEEIAERDVLHNRLKATRITNKPPKEVVIQ